MVAVYQRQQIGTSVHGGAAWAKGKLASVCGDCVPVACKGNPGYTADDSVQGSLMCSVT